MLKVSIIIPIYNAEKYMANCIDSLFNQTLPDYEIICVDDHSNERTALLLDDFANSDNRIKVIHLTERVGAGKARNIGMKQARGEYIMFLDSDDFFEREMVESLYKSISEFDADICICGYTTFSSGSNEVVNEYYPKQINGITDAVFKLSQLDEEGLELFNTAPWNKIYKKGFLEENGIEFQSLSSSNDVAFSWQSFIRADKICYCHNRKPLVNYRVNSGGQISSNKNSMNFYRAVENVLDSISDEMTPLLLSQIVYSYVKTAAYELRNCRDEAINRDFYVNSKKLLKTIEQGIAFKDKMICKMVDSFMSLGYDSQWFLASKLFYEYIKVNFNSLFSQIKTLDSIIIWGNGERSKALQQVLKENEYENVFIADKKNENIGNTTIEGYSIIHTDDVKNKRGIVIASNQIIYKFLKSQDIDCINLEEYCEITGG